MFFLMIMMLALSMTHFSLERKRRREKLAAQLPLQLQNLKKTQHRLMLTRQKIYLMTELTFQVLPRKAWKRPTRQIR